MLELYHSINSVCAQKVRIALAEKSLPYAERLMTLRGDQFDPAYMQLNPNAVVPTVVHDDKVIVESSVILYYLEEAFPDRPLMPTEPFARAHVRLFNKLIDEHVHYACMILTFATAFRPSLLRLSPEAREAGFAKSPSKQRAEYKRDVVAHGLDSKYAVSALEHYQKLLSSMEETLNEHGPYLAGGSYSLADVAVLPYILRLELLRMARLWKKRPGVASWWERVRERPSTQETIFKRMGEAEWAPFSELDADPWPKVRDLLHAA